MPIIKRKVPKSFDKTSVDSFTARPEPMNAPARPAGISLKE